MSLRTGLKFRLKKKNKNVHEICTKMNTQLLEKINHKNKTKGKIVNESFEMVGPGLSAR